MTQWRAIANIWCNKFVQILYRSYRLHKAIKLLDEYATSVDTTACYSGCDHTSDTSGTLKFSTSLFWIIVI